MISLMISVLPPMIDCTRLSCQSSQSCRRTRLRVPGADAAPWQDQAAIPIAPARARHRPGPRRPGVRREYDHQPGAPAASCVAPSAFAAVRDLSGMAALPTRPAMRLRIGHALTPGRSCHIG